MEEVYKIYQKGNQHIIERLTYPRFTGVLILKDNLYLPIITEVQMLDECNPFDLSQAMEDAGRHIDKAFKQ